MYCIPAVLDGSACFAQIRAVETSNAIIRLNQKTGDLVGLLETPHPKRSRKLLPASPPDLIRLLGPPAPRSAGLVLQSIPRFETGTRRSWRTASRCILPDVVDQFPYSREMMIVVLRGKIQMVYESHRRLQARVGNGSSKE